MSFQRCVRCGDLTPPDHPSCSRCGVPLAEQTPFTTSLPVPPAPSFGAREGAQPIRQVQGQPSPSFPAFLPPSGPDPGWGTPGGQPDWGQNPWAPPGPPAYATPRTKRNEFQTLFLRLLAVAGVVTVIGAGYFAVVRPVPGPKHPKQWDPRVSSIVSFVQQERGLKFKIPVYVDFLSPAEYRAVTAGKETQVAPTAAERFQAEDEVARYRALGLVSGKVDLLAATREVSDSGTLAFYSPKTERVTVRGTTITPALRVTLAHELTHALQDQHFDLKHIYRLQGVDDTLLRSVVEGDATRIENRYVDSVLTESEQASYQAEQQTSSDDAEGKLGKVPDVILTGFQVPYIFGPSFVNVLYETGGNAAINRAITKPPLSLEQIVDPLVYVRGQLPTPVPPITAPSGAVTLDHGSFGTVMWYLMLSERIGPYKALSAVDGLGGDTMIEYRHHGRVCVEARFVGDIGRDTEQMADALHTWARAMPAGRATVSTDGRAASFRSCDPGAGVDLGANGTSSKALGYLAVRSEIMSSALQDGATQRQAGCLANAIVGNLTLDEITDKSGTFAQSGRLAGIVQAARRNCA